jgi:hypothetical protein
VEEYFLLSKCYLQWTNLMHVGIEFVRRYHLVTKKGWMILCRYNVRRLEMIPTAKRLQLRQSCSHCRASLALHINIRLERSITNCNACYRKQDATARNHLTMNNFKMLLMILKHKLSMQHCDDDHSRLLMGRVTLRIGVSDESA